MTIEIAMDGDPIPPPTAVSAVSWAAALSGAVVAVALSLVLFALGLGLGLAAASPWAGLGAGAAAFTVMAGVWLIVMQWLSSAVGGYVAGRLRSRWIGTHTHEVFFRDTAHGLLTWAVATVAVSAIAAATAASVAGGAARAVAPAAAYDADRLLRSSSAGETAGLAEARAETLRIVAAGVAGAGVSGEDQVYLTRLVSAQTGLAPPDAARRVQDLVAREKAAADKARKSASAFAIFTALSMLIGAFIACVAAALGGQQRDEHP